MATVGENRHQRKPAAPSPYSPAGPNPAIAAALANSARQGGNVTPLSPAGASINLGRSSDRRKILWASCSPHASDRARARKYHLQYRDRRRNRSAAGRDHPISTSMGIRLSSVATNATISRKTQKTTILNAAPLDPLPGSRLRGLLFRKPVGAGVCFTMATLPQPPFTNFATHPTFLPLLVRMALANSAAKAQNVELGQPLTLDAPGETQIQIQGPQHELYRIQSPTGHFIFPDATEPGILLWQKITGDQPLAMTNIQLPADESLLTYRSPQASPRPAPPSVIATSVADFQSQIAEPERTSAITASGPIAIVMFLTLSRSPDERRQPQPREVAVGTRWMYPSTHVAAMRSSRCPGRFKAARKPATSPTSPAAACATNYSASTPKDFGHRHERPARSRPPACDTQAVGAAFGVILVRQRKSVIEVATFRTDLRIPRRPPAGRREVHNGRGRRPAAAISRSTASSSILWKIASSTTSATRADPKNKILRARWQSPISVSPRIICGSQRPVRFASRFSLQIDPVTATAIAAHAHELPRISPERHRRRAAQHAHADNQKHRLETSLAIKSARSIIPFPPRRRFRRL